MPPAYHPRHLAPTLEAAATQFPAVVLTGARQAGKTTLVREVFGRTHAYFSLDDPLTDTVDAVPFGAF